MKLSKRVPGVVAAVPVAGALIFGGTAQAAPTPQRGIDVSSYQHPGGKNIHWPSVARAGYKFAFIKDTEGSYYVNPYYASDAKSAEAAGLAVASYAFAVPNRSSGSAQANYLINHGGSQQGDARARVGHRVEPLRVELLRAVSVADGFVDRLVREHGARPYGRVGDDQHPVYVVEHLHREVSCIRQPPAVG